MGILQRQRVLMQVDAAERRFIAIAARAVNIGMAGGSDYLRAVRDLELTHSKAEIVDGAWDILALKNRG